jgi:hypothetical protein
VLSNAVNPPPADRLPAADPPPAAVAPPAADPQPVSAAKTTAAPSVTNAKSTSAVDQPVASPDHNAHGQSDGSSAQPSANELQS